MMNAKDELESAEIKKDVVFPPDRCLIIQTNHFWAVVRVKDFCKDIPEYGNFGALKELCDLMIKT